MDPEPENPNLAARQREPSNVSQQLAILVGGLPISICQQRSTHSSQYPIICCSTNTLKHSHGGGDGSQHRGDQQVGRVCAWAAPAVLSGLFQTLSRSPPVAVAVVLVCRLRVSLGLAPLSDKPAQAKPVSKGWDTWARHAGARQQQTHPHVLGPPLPCRLLLPSPRMNLPVLQSLQPGLQSEFAQAPFTCMGSLQPAAYCSPVPASVR